jgi:hypothetical protein
MSLSVQSTYFIGHTENKTFINHALQISAMESVSVH